MDYYRSGLHKIRTALGLSAAEWAIFIKAWAGLLVIDLFLRSRSFTRVQQWVDSRYKARPAIPSGQPWEIIRRHQRLVELAARYSLYRMECLRQALVLQALLGAVGLRTEIRFGARKTGEQFLAHAWLEYEGQSIELSNVYENYQPLKTLEERR